MKKTKTKAQTTTWYIYCPTPAGRHLLLHKMGQRPQWTCTPYQAMQFITPPGIENMRAIVAELVSHHVAAFNAARAIDAKEWASLTG